MAMTFTGPSGAVVTYKGQTNFADLFTPAPGKNDWGVDTLQRVVSGAAPELPDYVDALRQGQVYIFRGKNFYLQTWDPDKNAVYPQVTLNYKGLTNGLPPRTGQSKSIQQSVTLSASAAGTNFGLPVENYGNLITASRTIQYIARQTTWRYVRQLIISAAQYGDLEASVEPVIISSVITVTNKEGATFEFNGAVAPAGLVTALTGAVYNLTLAPDTNPIFGTPYFECSETVTRLIQGT